MLSEKSGGIVTKMCVYIENTKQFKQNFFFFFFFLHRVLSNNYKEPSCFWWFSESEMLLKEL